MQARRLAFALVLVLGWAAVAAAAACGGRRAMDGDPTSSSSSTTPHGPYEVRDSSPESTSGWTKIGERQLDPSGSGKDSVRAPADAPKVSSVRFVLQHGKVEISDIVVSFDDGSKVSIPTKFTFGKGTTSRAIDFTGDPKIVRGVEWKYSNTMMEGRNAQIEVWTH
jgi:hypothetical protein